MQLNLVDRFLPAQSAMPRGDEGCFRSSQEDPADSSGAQLTSLAAEICDLKAQLEQLRSERGKWMEIQRRMMELLHTTAPEKLVHDLRNLLNERDLLKTLVDQL
jgi:hypothetical protein